MADIQQRFKEAFETHSDELFRHAALRVSDRERAVELVQDTFVRAWEYARRGEDIRDVRPFLFRTLRNLIIDEYRKRKSISLESMLREEDESTEVFMPPDETNTLEAAMVRFDGVRVLRIAYKLEAPYREAILLRYVEGWTPKEIAEHLEVSENVVSVRIHRALKKLRALMEDEHNIYE